MMTVITTLVIIFQVSIIQFVKLRFIGVNLKYSALKSYTMRDSRTKKVRDCRTSLSELYIGRKHVAPGLSYLGLSA